MSTQENTFSKRWDDALMHTYPTPEVTMVRGDGATLFDEQGNDYIDFLAGIAVNSLGYNHPEVVEAVSSQIRALPHVSNLLGSRPVVQAAEGLIARVDEGFSAELESPKVFFCNSGAEANEAAFKIARRTGRSKVISTHHGFHGRTMGALALSGQPSKQAPFEPLPSGVEFCDYGDLDAVTNLVKTNPEDVAAIILEPIQGETGIIPAPEGYLTGVAELCRRHGILFIADEVQSGIGRTGDFLATHHEDVLPDVITFAKGLGAGLPIGACLAHGRAATLLGVGEHGTTFGGNPVACAAAGVVLDTIDRGFLSEVRRKGEILRDGLTRIPGVGSVRGRGLMLAAVLERGVAKQAVSVGLKARDGHGVVLNAPGVNVVRFVPPLVITDEELDEGLKRIADVFDRAATTREQS